MLEMAKVWGSQDKLGTGSGVSIREELIAPGHSSWVWTRARTMTNNIWRCRSG